VEISLSKQQERGFLLWKVAIPYQELPKTIQDAVITSHELGIPFLWIDSLCIMQNDPEDIAWEISQMPDIYNNASITIAASRSCSVLEGFLQNREINYSPNLVFELPYRCPNKKHGSVILFQSAIPKGDEPLDNRAWALQERLLSLRILEFGRVQNRWICPGSENGEGYRDRWRSSAAVDKYQIDSTIFLFNSTEATDRSYTFRRQKLVGDWRFIVKKYTKRDLTVASDRILGISALAEKYGLIFRDDYLAGLWKSLLPSELLWTNIGSRHRRPQTCQGPSWSWTGITGPITYTEPYCITSIDMKADSSLDFITSEIKLRNEIAPYGAVEFGHLQGRGRMRPTRWMRGEGCPGKGGQLRLRDTEGWDSALFATFQPDALEDEFVDSAVDSIPVHILDVIQRVPPYCTDSFKGLVLRELQDGRFSRLGVYTFEKACMGPCPENEDGEVWKQRWEDQLHWFEWV
jgi:hypothetical protein